MLLAVIKDLGDVWNRLFDHRPFLSGEIKYFIKEFEETRGDREVVRLADIGEWLNDIELNQITKLTSSIPDFTKLNTLIDIAEQTCNTVLEEEDNFDVDKLLADKRAIRKAEWDKIEKELAEKYAKIDEKFSENEKGVILFYENLDKKLSDQRTVLIQ